MTTHEDAVAFLTPAAPWRGRWADVGAGSGTFTRAMAELIGAEGVVYAVDRDERAISALDKRADQAGREDARIIPVRGDMHQLSTIVELSGVELDGVLFANALHFTRNPEDVLAQAAERLRPDGRIVVIEYDRRMPNPWVPHPLPFERLADVARRAGLGVPEGVARRPSSYHREMYCAVVAR